MENVIFYVSAVLMVYCAVRAVSSPYIFRAALYLAATLSLTAVQYLLMHFEFVAVVQLLVYVGAVIVLIIFAVMLTAQLGEGDNSQSNRLALPAFLLVLILGYGLLKLISENDWSKVAAAPASVASEPALGNIQVIGMALMGNYAFPLEMTGLVLFTALIGAVLIARKDPGQ